MISKKKIPYIIKNPLNQTLIFSINKNNELVINEYKNSLLIDNKILLYSIIDFSICIDNEKNIHILCLNNEGNVLHCCYGETNGFTTIFNIDLNKFQINFLTLKLIKNKFHVFYIAKDILIPSKYTLFHSIYNNYCFTVNEVTEFNCSYFPAPYSIDYYNEKIYILFEKNSSNKYFIKKFDITENTWLREEEHINEINCSNPLLYITEKGMSLFLCSITINKCISTCIKYKDLAKPNNSWSDFIFLSEENSNSLHPSIIYDLGYVYVLWKEGNFINYKKTNDMLNWSSKTSINSALLEKVSSAVFLDIDSNNFNKNTNSTVVYYLDTFPYSIINLEKNVPKKENLQREKRHITNYKLKVKPPNNSFSNLTSTNITNIISLEKDFEYLVNKLNNYEASISLVENKIHYIITHYEKLLQHNDTKIRYLENVNKLLLSKLNSDFSNSTKNKS